MFHMNGLWSRWRKRTSDMALLDRRTAFLFWRRQNFHGWQSLVSPLIDLCEQHGVEILQIKEKFGGLRFYVGEMSDENVASLSTAINVAEDASFRICQDCGAPGVLRGGGWLRTLCHDCHAKRQHETIVYEPNEAV